MEEFLRELSLLYLVIVAGIIAGRDLARLALGIEFLYCLDKSRHKRFQNDPLDWSKSCLIYGIDSLYRIEAAPARRLGYSNMCTRNSGCDG